MNLLTESKNLISQRCTQQQQESLHFHVSISKAKESVKIRCSQSNTFSIHRQTISHQNHHLSNFLTPLSAFGARLQLDEQQKDRARKLTTHSPQFRQLPPPSLLPRCSSVGTGVCLLMRVRLFDGKRCLIGCDFCFERYSVSEAPDVWSVHLHET